MWRVSSISEVPDLPIDRSLVVVDLENTLIPYRGADRQPPAGGMPVDLPDGFGAVAVVSNSRDQALGQNLEGVETVVMRAHKPFSSIPRLSGLLGGRPTLVIGDQILTDGLLAWRLGVPFVLVLLSRREPWWPRTLRRLGRVIRPMFLDERPKESR